MRVGRAVRRVSALLVVVLVVGLCLGAHVFASPSAHHECNALTDGRTILSKPPVVSPSLVGIPVEPARVAVVPSDAVGQSPSHAAKFAAAAPSDGPPARSPPASL